MALAWTAAAFIAGATAAALFGVAAWPLALALCAALIALALARHDRRALLWAAALPLVFGLGLLRFELTGGNPAPNDVSQFQGEAHMRVRGVVRGESVVGDTTQRFAVSVQSVQRAGVWHQASGGVQVVTGLFPRYHRGDVIELEGQLEAPSRDGEFDYAAYLERAGIHTVTAFPQITLVGREEPAVAVRLLDGARSNLAHGLNAALPEPQSSLAMGLLLGRKSALPGDLRENLNATNTSHLVVVSGANIVLVSAFAAGALTWLFGRRPALMLSIAAIICYVLLVGLSPPVVRGAIMGVLLVIAQASGRRTNGLTSICFAAALMIAAQPHAVRDVSFQLSFAATAGIVFLAGPLRELTLEAIARLTRWETVPGAIDAFVVLPLVTTIAAFAATEPLIALNFGRLSLVAIPANMLVVPLFPVILGSTALAAVGGMLPVGGTMLAAPAYYALTYWIEVADVLASLPLASMTMSGFTSWWSAASYIVLALAAVALLRALPRQQVPRVGKPLDVRSVFPFAAAAVPVAALVASAGFIMQPDAEPRLRVTFLDVGQGDAVLIQTPRGGDVLIDGGPGPAVLRQLGRELAWQDRSIETVILTHGQADHAGGLLDVLGRYEVDRVIAGPGAGDSNLHEAWIDAVAAEGAAVETVGAGTIFDLGDGVTLEVLSPAGSARETGLNDLSLVMRLAWRDVSMLFTGDIELAAEQALVDSGANIDADVLKVAHHGSRSSSSAAFLDAVSPLVAVVSSGAGNRYGHPDAGVMQRLRAQSDAYVTADDGAVGIETDGARIWIRTRE